MTGKTSIIGDIVKRAMCWLPRFPMRIRRFAHIVPFKNI